LAVERGLASLVECAADDAPFATERAALETDFPTLEEEPDELDPLLGRLGAGDGARLGEGEDARAEGAAGWLAGVFLGAEVLGGVLVCDFPVWGAGRL
jgi:hypothetical protein